MARGWTDKEIATARSLRAQGLSNAKIGARLVGRSAQAVYSALANREDGHTPRRYRSAEELLARRRGLLALFQGGVTMLTAARRHELAREYGVTASHISTEIMELHHAGCLDLTGRDQRRNCYRWVKPYDLPVRKTPVNRKGSEPEKYTLRECLYRGCKTIFKSPHSGVRMCDPHRKETAPLDYHVGRGR